MGVLPGWFSVWLPLPAHGTALFLSLLVAKKLLWIRVVASAPSPSQQSCEDQGEPSCGTRRGHSEPCLPRRETRPPPSWHLPRNPILGPGILVQRQEPLGKQMLLSPRSIVGISLAGSLGFICSTEDKKPRVLWETGRPYLPSQAASPATASLFFPPIPDSR